MQFKHSQLINAPAEYVFQRITNFEAFESYSGTKGFSFQRRDNKSVRIGTQWNISFVLRGRTRRFRAALSELIPPRTVSYSSTSPKYSAAMSLTVTPVSPRSSTLDMLLVAQPRSFSATLVFNSFRLGRRRVNKRISKYMQDVADRLAADYAAPTD